MKTYVSLLFIICLLNVKIFPQDTDRLYLKSGEYIEGFFQGRKKNKILFKSLQQKKTIKFKLSNILLIYRKIGVLESFYKEHPKQFEFPKDIFDIIMTEDGKLLKISKPVYASDTISYENYLTKVNEKLPIKYISAIIDDRRGLVVVSSIPEIAKLLYTATYIDSLDVAIKTLRDTIPDFPYPETSKTRDENSVNLSKRMPVSDEEFKERGLQKIKDFQRYLEQLIKSRNNRERKRSLKNRILTLFLKDSCMVEVSNKYNFSKEIMAIRNYIERVSNYGELYDRVNVKYAQMVAVSEIRKMGDEWIGIISFAQSFEGYNNEGQLIYNDITYRNSEIILKVLKEVNNGVEQIYWDVFLCNITAEETK